MACDAVFHVGSDWVYSADLDLDLRLDSGLDLCLDFDFVRSDSDFVAGFCGDSRCPSIDVCFEFWWKL